MSHVNLEPLRSTFQSGVTRPLKWRLQQLEAVRQMLLENRKAWEAALAVDLGKPAFDTWTTEISQVTAEIRHLKKSLPKLMRDTKAKTPLALTPASSRIRKEPLGVVAVISPWNYPLQLLCAPLAGALAAGNCVVLKPSEIATATEALVAELVPQYFDADVVQVVTGGPETVTRLIENDPDLVFFTGSTQVGAIIAEQCGKRLIPVTLELGGKSPVYVHKDANLKKAARRIVWGKFLNAGQTCVAPDHVYVHRAVANRFARAVQREITKQFGRNPQASRNYGRIINAKNFDRLEKLITAPGSAQIRAGGEVDRSDRYIAPTVIFPAQEDHPTMSEEIFGPILPILPVSSADAAITRITKRPHPLAFYVFTGKKKIREKLLREVPSGGVAVNATVIHLSSNHVPFGGVGASGMGNYHGDWSFRTFTHERTIVSKPLTPDTLALVTPPVNRVTKSLVKNLLLRG